MKAKTQWKEHGLGSQRDSLMSYGLLGQLYISNLHFIIGKMRVSTLKTYLESDTMGAQHWAQCLVPRVKSRYLLSWTTWTERNQSHGESASQRFTEAPSRQGVHAYFLVHRGQGGYLPTRMAIFKLMYSCVLAEEQPWLAGEESAQLPFGLLFIMWERGKEES